jgi:hypothetical protein
MRLVKDSSEPFDWHKLDIAHDMCHVLGLVLEHQAADRDDFVHFDCTKLKGYDEVIDYPSMDEICASNSLGEDLF